MAQKHGSQSAWEWRAAWLCWSPSVLRGVSLEAGQPQLPAWGSWRWRPGELTNSGGRSTAWGWKAICRSGSSQALVSSPSTAGGYLAKNFMQLLDTQKEEIKRYDFWLKWKRISDWIWWRSKKKHCEKCFRLANPGTFTSLSLHQLCVVGPERKGDTILISALKAEPCVVLQFWIFFFKTTETMIEGSVKFKGCG